MMTIDEKEAFRKIWNLISSAEQEFTELRLASGLDKIRAANVRCSTFARQVNLNGAGEPQPEVTHE